MPLPRHLVGFYGTGKSVNIGLPVAPRDESQLLSRVLVIAAPGHEISPDLSAALMGVAAAGSAGSVLFPNMPMLAGVSAGGSVGTVASGSVALTTVGAASFLVTGAISPDHSSALTGPTATGSAGTVVWGKAVPLSGLFGIGSVVSVSAGANTITLSGVTALTTMFGAIASATKRGVTGASCSTAVASVSLGARTLQLSGVNAFGTVTWVYHPSLFVTTNGKNIITTGGLQLVTATNVPVVITRETGQFIATETGVTIATE